LVFLFPKNAICFLAFLINLQLFGSATGWPLTAKVEFQSRPGAGADSIEPVRPLFIGSWRHLWAWYSPDSVESFKPVSSLMTVL